MAKHTPPDPDPNVPPPPPGDWTPPPGYPAGYPPPGYPPYQYPPGVYPPPLGVPQQAKHIVQKYSWWAAAGGLFPLPEVDIVLIAGTNFLMVRELSALYGIPFHANRVRTAIAALLAGALPPTLAGAWGFSRLLRYVPLIGQTLVPFGTSVFAAAVTYAVGRAFISHYTAGGTLNDLDLDDRLRHWFRSHWNERDAPPPAPSPATT